MTRKGAMYALFAILISQLLLSGGALVVSLNTVQQLKASLCSVVEPMMDPSLPAPTTPRGKEQYDRMKDLHRDLGCKSRSHTP